MGSGPAQQAMLSEGSDPEKPPNQIFELNFEKVGQKRSTRKTSGWWRSGGGGARELLRSWGGTPSGIQGNPYPKLKTLRIWPLFLGETPVHVQNQTKIKMNVVDSLKLEGSAPTTSKLWGQVAPSLRPRPWGGGKK